jgi:hypothetical protein
MAECGDHSKTAADGLLPIKSGGVGDRVAGDISRKKRLVPKACLKKMAL